jgi:hypothetical protein
MKRYTSVSEAVQLHGPAPSPAWPPSPSLHPSWPTWLLALLPCPAPSPCCPALPPTHPPMPTQPAHPPAHSPTHVQIRHSEEGLVSVSLQGNEFCITTGRALMLDETHQVSPGCASAGALVGLR